MMKRVVAQEEAEAEEQRAKADVGLNMLLLKPENLSGSALFEHMVMYCQRAVLRKEQNISKYLNVEFRGKHQEDIMAHAAARRLQHNIMREIGSSGSVEKLAKRKLDALGYIKSHSCFINDPTRIERLRSKLLLAKSLEHIKAIETKKAVKSKQEEGGDFKKFLSEAVQLYGSIKEDGKAPRKFTKKHIHAILLLCFDLRVSGNKGDMVSALADAVKNAPHKLTAD